MKDYLLFIDTEASCLPKNWNSPYTEEGNWPYSLQISWVVYTSAGQWVKQEDFYVSNNDITIDPSAIKVHGITSDKLQKEGTPRVQILQRLAEDVAKYDPMVVGHFMQFDFRMLAADFHRAGLENPIQPEHCFCTMLATKRIARNPSAPYLKLSQLYSLLFNKKLENVHNALVDAKATALCFFELIQRKEITAETISKQQQEMAKESESKNKGCLPLIIFIAIVSYLML